jgi:hypothetical protein
MPEQRRGRDDNANMPPTRAAEVLAEHGTLAAEQKRPLPAARDRRDDRLAEVIVRSAAGRPAARNFTRCLEAASALL